MWFYCDVVYWEVGDSSELVDDGIGMLYLEVVFVWDG